MDKCTYMYFYVHILSEYLIGPFSRPANQYDLVVFSTIFRSKYDSTIFLNKIWFKKKKKKKKKKNYFYFLNEYFVCASAIFNGKMSILSCKVSYKYLPSAIWGCSLVHRTHQFVTK